jgi:hypothetical protein
VVVVVAVTISPKVAHTHAVPTPETVTIRFALFRPKMWVTVLVAIVYVWAPVVVKIPARAFDSIMETAALNFVQLSWRGVPTAAIIAILAYDRIGWPGGRSICPRRDQASSSQRKSKCWHC